MTEYTLQEVAQLINVDKSSARKALNSFGFQPIAKKQTPTSRGVRCSIYSVEQIESFIKLREERGYVSHEFEGDSPSTSVDNLGWFYAIQLLPEFYPTRVKLGFAVSVPQRLASHRTVAPTAVLLRQWRCRRIWELTVIASVTREESILVGGEVFDVENLDNLIGRVDQFFEVMPNL